MAQKTHAMHQHILLGPYQLQKSKNSLYANIKNIYNMKDQNSITPHIHQLSRKGLQRVLPSLKQDTNLKILKVNIYKHQEIQVIKEVINSAMKLK